MQLFGDYFIDYVSTVQTFSKLFAGRNSFDLVNISGRSFTSMCGSFTSLHRKAGSQLLRSCRSSNSWQTVDSAEQKFLLLLLNSVAKVSAEVAQSILAFLRTSQNISGRVTLRSSHCCERLPLQSLMLGTWLSSSVALSRHWLLFTCNRVNFLKTK